MEKLITLFVVLVTCNLCEASPKAFFQENELNTIRVVDITEKKARVQNSRGSQVDIQIGDTIGKTGGKVVEIEKSHISVEEGQTRTRIPLIYGFER